MRKFRLLFALRPHIYNLYNLHDCSFKTLVEISPLSWCFRHFSFRGIDHICNCSWNTVLPPIRAVPLTLSSEYESIECSGVNLFCYSLIMF